MVQVNTVAPGLGPVEVEQQISARVESVMSGMPGLKLVRSMSKYGLSRSAGCAGGWRRGGWRRGVSPGPDT